MISPYYGTEGISSYYDTEGTSTACYERTGDTSYTIYDDYVFHEKEKKIRENAIKAKEVQDILDYESALILFDLVGTPLFPRKMIFCKSGFVARKGKRLKGKI